MTKCDACKSTFSWGKVFKANLFYSPIACEKCGAEHKITNPSRLLVTFLTIIPMMAFIIFLSPFNNAFINIFIGLLIFGMGLLISPYVVSYKKMSNNAAHSG